MFTLMSNVNTRTTRSHPLYLLVPIGQKKSFVGIATALWNQLPASIMSISNVNQFKQKIYDMLLKDEILV